MALVKGTPAYMDRAHVASWLIHRSRRTTDGCLLVDGYGPAGSYQKGPGRAWAHIAAYAAFVGDHRPDLDVSHLCHNPQCIEPTHLTQEPHAVNVARRRGRPVKDCGHERTHTATGHIAPCRQCNADAQRRWRNRNITEESPR